MAKRFILFRPEISTWTTINVTRVCLAGEAEGAEEAEEERAFTFLKIVDFIYVRLLSKQWKITLS